MTEFSRFLYVLGRYDCRSYLEIGSADGDSFLAVASVMERAVAIDWPGQSWGTRGTERVLERRCEDLREKMCVDARAYFGDSCSAEMVEAAKKHGPYDAVFIDGDHSYEGVKSDWENYGGMGAKLVAFHDVGGRDIATKGVWRFWQELKEEGYATVEFFEDWGERPMGIGIVLK